MKAEFVNLTEILDTHHDVKTYIGGDHANFSKEVLSLLKMNSLKSTNA